MEPIDDRRERPGSDPDESHPGLATPAAVRAGEWLWATTGLLCLGLVFSAVLTGYDLTHPDVFYAGSPDSMNGSLGYLLAEQVGTAQLVLTPVVVILLLFGTARLNDGSAGWRTILGLTHGGFLLCCANWFSTRPRQDRTGPELGWVHDAASPGWVRFLDQVSPALVVGAALLGAVLLLVAQPKPPG